jgi:8-oxo-dGTP pyrophosphatase MutT (NUDIX family)
VIVKAITVELDAHYFNRLLTARGDLDTRSGVVMVLPRPGNRILVLTKSFFAAGVYNLPTGGIHPGETPEQAFAREVIEETGLPSEPQSMVGRLDQHCTFEDQSLDFKHYFILGTETSEPPHPADDSESISGYMDATPDDLRKLAEHMRRLTGLWLGFGRFRAPALDFVADRLQ